MLVTYPRLGHNLQVGAPENPKYRPPKAVWDRVVELGCDKRIVMTADPREAVHGADVVLTDTWISMGQEAEKAQRLKDLEGFQVTEKLCKEGGANPDWKFMHCLPAFHDPNTVVGGEIMEQTGMTSGLEVTGEVFESAASVVFDQAENRLHTIKALLVATLG